MQSARVYWICTSGDGRPHATPVDGVWIESRLYFGGDPTTKWQRNLRANPAACVHLDSAEGVLILDGAAEIAKGVDSETARRLAAASRTKYGYGMAAADYEKADIAVFRPRVVIAWTDLTKDPTRWRLG